MTEPSLEELTSAQIRKQLAGKGLSLRLGAFVFSLRSSVRELDESLRQQYARHRVASSDSFIDFSVRVRQSPGPRRLLKPQAIFEVEGQRPFHPMARSQAFALFEWGLNWCIYSHCHHLLIFHGAVLAQGEHAILLPAPSGSGKSTLCAALMLRGWRLLSDELILLDPADGTLTPVCRPVGLKNESIDVIRNFSPNAVLSNPVHDTSKGTVAHLAPTAGSVAQANTSAQPRWLVFPRFLANSELQVAPIKKTSAFIRLMRNAFNYSALGLTGFNALSNLIDQVDAYQITFGDLNSAVHWCDQLVKGNDK
ncbi:HprK-related kinase A [Congregibacter variabilis]|uniref:HprK-related kinase A n=1 Tax=Congregibacter variabilis TaxID=3081200 RepID=A0ABZ0I688_9GAMM|nr:HprK-related kinase A [Congregibacter sp. IMCC43200]